MRGDTLISVCSYGCVVGLLKNGLYKLNGFNKKLPDYFKIPRSLLTLTEALFLGTLGRITHAAPLALSGQSIFIVMLNITG